MNTSRRRYADYILAAFALGIKPVSYPEWRRMMEAYGGAPCQ